MRRSETLNRNWLFIGPDKKEVPVSLPHTLNAVDGQDGGNDYWRGTAAYMKRFSRPLMPEGNRCFLSVKGAAMTAEVFLNG